LFLVADKNMAAILKGFLGRERFFESLGTSRFMFEPIQDLLIASGDNDPGLFVRAHELLAPYRLSHRHVVVIVDASWDGSPGASAIKRTMTANLEQQGWTKANSRVIVIDPELENWVWQKNIHVAHTLGCSTLEEMLDLVGPEAWPTGQPKPNTPKDLLERLLRHSDIPRSSSIYGAISEHVSISGCRDVAFLELRRALQTWFPAVPR